MLAVSPPRGSQYGDERDGGDADAFSTLDDFSDETFLDDINFDGISAGFDVDCGALPDLELDPAEIFSEISFLGAAEDDDANVSAAAEVANVSAAAEVAAPGADGGAGAQDGAAVSSEYKKDPGGPQEVLRPATREHSIAVTSSEAGSTSSQGSVGGGKPPAATAKSLQGKKKTKVDWTPELHRRFVQAVEHLGVEKAVPSRILELMGIECLTRHNIASHLQKYRSHRKHALAREAEAASCWTQRRPQTHAAAGAAQRWFAPPTIGFPPPPPPHVPPPRFTAPAVQHFRPLRVWGHPTGDLQHAPFGRAWPRHGPAAPPPPWAPPPPTGPLPPPTPHASYWRHCQYQMGVREGWTPHAVTQGTPPCFAPAPMPTAASFLAPPVPASAAGVLPPVHRPVLRPATAQLRPSSQLQLDAHPTKESVDAAIEDVMRKPWLPMPLGLKPPSVDSVLRELQMQGVVQVPPSCTTTTTTTTITLN